MWKTKRIDLKKAVSVMRAVSLGRVDPILQSRGGQEMKNGTCLDKRLGSHALRGGGANMGHGRTEQIVGLECICRNTA